MLCLKHKISDSPADVQPKLSRYYSLTHVATDTQGQAAGLTQLLHREQISSDLISQTRIDNLDVIESSDDPEGKLPHWIPNTLDGRFRLKRAMGELDKDD